MNQLRPGFTLIEMLVSMVLIVTFSAFGIVKFQATSKARTVENAAAKLRQTYITARANALAGKKNCEACKSGGNSGTACLASDLPLQSWEVYLDTVGQSVTTQGRCGITNTAPYDPSGLRSFTMQGGAAQAEALPNLTYTLSISPPPAVNISTLYFRPLSGGVYPGIGSNQTITIRVSDGTNRRAFDIKGDGSIGPVYTP